MFCKTYSAVLHGLEAVTVQVETDVRNGLPQLQMVGALASEAKEARDRVRIAIENAGASCSCITDCQKTRSGQRVRRERYMERKPSGVSFGLNNRILQLF